MGARSGLDAQLGLAEESTYGTYVAAARFLPFVSEGMKYDIARNSSKGIRTGQRVDRTDQWIAGRKDPKGTIELELANKGFGLLFKHALGTVTTTTDGTGKKHSCVIGDLYGKGLSVQIGRPDVAATVQPFTYTGTKIDEMEISQSLSGDGFPMLKLSTVAQDQTTAQTLATASAPAETELFHWSGLGITVAGSAYSLLGNASIKVKTSLKEDRFKAGSATRLEPIENKRRDITGSLVGEFESLTAYNRVVNGTVVPVVFTWSTVSTYDTAKPYKLVVTLPNCRFDSEVPNASEDVLQQTLNFVALDDGSSAPITVDYYTSDTSP